MIILRQIGNQLKKQWLVSKVHNLKSHREQLAKSIREIRESEIYQTIESIDDWGDYFKEQSDAIQKKIEGMHMTENHHE